MTAQGGDLLAWLDNAISVREAAAMAAATPYGSRWTQGFPEQHKDPELRYGWSDDCVYVCENDPHVFFQAFSEQVAALAVLNDPESVLRRCAADRKELARHTPTEWPTQAPAVCPSCARWNNDVAMGDSAASPVPFPCPSVLSLAEGYGWTEGER